MICMRKKDIIFLSLFCLLCMRDTDSFHYACLTFDNVEVSGSHSKLPMLGLGSVSSNPERFTWDNIVYKIAIILLVYL